MVTPERLSRGHPSPLRCPYLGGRQRNLNRALRSAFNVTLIAIIAGCNASTPQEHLDKAVAYRAQGNTNAAVIELKNALQKDPNLAEARLALGEVYLETGELDPALKELNRARDLGIPDDRVLPSLLETKVDLGQRQEVLGELDKVKLTPRYQAVRGQALAAGGDVEAARGDFETAIQSDPTLPRAYLGLARLAMSGPTRDLAAATQILEEGVKAVPTNRRLWVVLGEVQLNQGHPADAGNAFDRAAALPGNDLVPELGLVRVRLLENKPKDASAILDRILARVPKHPIAQHLKGVIALSANNLSEAETAFQTALSVAPDYAPSLLALANVKYAQGEPNQAETYLRRYIAKDPENVGSRKSLAALLLDSGDATGAVEVLQPVADRLADGTDLTLLGTAYLRSGKLDEASRYLTAATQAAPQSPEGKTQLALSLAAAGDSAGALAQLDSLIPNADATPDTTLTQADTLRVLVNLRSGKLDAALAAATQMVAREDAKPLPHHLLGAVQAARKDNAAARSEFERALALDPKFVAAAIDLARLDTLEGKTADARRHLESSIAVNPGDVGLLMALAELEFAQGGAAKAEALLQQARTANPTAVLPRVALGRLALDRGETGLAHDVSIEVEGIDPNSPQVLLLRALESAQANNSGELDHYLDRLQTYISQNPADIALYWVPVGDLLRRAGRWDPARELLRQALNSSSAGVPALISLVQLETAANSLNAARTYLARLKENGGDQAIVAELAGDIELKAGAPGKAIDQYRQSAETGVASGRATAKLALTQARAGDSKAAIATLENRLTAAPDDNESANLLASLQLESGDTVAAMRSYEALLVRRPNDAIALNNLAWLYFDAKDPRAETLARKAVAAAPTRAELGDTLGWILVHNDAPGATSEALALLESAAKAQPDNPSVLYHLAVAQQRAGRRREASQSVERALATKSFVERDAAQQLASDLGLQ